MLCPNDKVGIVISTEGRTVTSLHKKTGAYIIIDDVVLGFDECIITVSAFEVHPSHSPC